MMKELRLHYPIPLVRRVLSVSASGYYAWLDRPLSKWAGEEARLEIEIKAAHKRTRQVCGAERLQHDLVERGISGESSVYAVNRRGNSRPPPTQSIPFR